MDSAIKMAEDRQIYVSGDEDTIRAYEMREKVIWDLTSGLNHARKEGIMEGKIEIARKLKARGYPITEIAEDTELSQEVIEKLQP
jgi:predicted transposase/invertase (TIGR01784 family)